LGRERIGGVLDRFSAASIGYVQFGGREGPGTCYGSVLEVRADGSWSWLGDPPTGVAKGRRQTLDPGISE
jgi:hypothetical protein